MAVHRNSCSTNLLFGRLALCPWLCHSSKFGSEVKSRSVFLQSRFFYGKTTSCVALASGAGGKVTTSLAGGVDFLGLGFRKS